MSSTVAVALWESIYIRLYLCVGVYIDGKSVKLLVCRFLCEVLLTLNVRNK